MIKGKSVEGMLPIGYSTLLDMYWHFVKELRKHFSLANDFTPEEEAKLIAENEWCDEP